MSREIQVRITNPCDCGTEDHFVLERELVPAGKTGRLIVLCYECDAEIGSWE